MTLALTADEVAGVVDLFGALTRPELDEALAELAYRRGEDPPDDAVVERALDRYALVAYEPPDGEERLAPGPTAFPTLPEEAADLPHILDVDSRDVDREALGRAVEERFRAEVASAVAAGNDDRMRDLLDASYDLEAWAPVDLAGLRDRLDDALAE